MKTTVPVYVLPVLLIRIRTDLYQNRIRIGIKVKVQELWSGGSKWSHGGRCQWSIEDQNGVSRPVQCVADSHHFDEKQNPDPHQSERRDPDSQHCFSTLVNMCFSAFFLVVFERGSC